MRLKGWSLSFLMLLLLAIPVLVWVNAAKSKDTNPVQAAQTVGEPTLPKQEPAKSVTVPSPVSPSLFLKQVKLLNPPFGWGVDQDGHVLRTASGGESWEDVSPNDVPSPLFPFFLNELTAWVYNETTQSTYRTIDGGQTWQQGGIVKPSIVHDGGFSLFFLDETLGWLELMSGGHGQVGELFRTKDGGRTWVWVSKTGERSGMPADGSSLLRNTSLPFGGAVSFVDANNGWTARGTDEWLAYPEQLWLFHTGDGGATWSHQALPFPDGFQDKWKRLGAPQFFDDRNGVLPVLVRSDNDEIGFIFSTADGGASWTRTPPMPKEMGSWSRVGFMDSRNGWAWGGESQAVYYRTTDGGNHWQPAAIDPAISYSDHLEFRNPVLGLRLSYGSSSMHLSKTTDGGKSWKQLDPKLIAQNQPDLQPLATISADLFGDGPVKVDLLANLNGDVYPVDWRIQVDGVNQAVLTVEETGIFGKDTGMELSDADGDGRPEVWITRQSTGSAGALGLTVFRPLDGWRKVFEIDDPFDMDYNHESGRYEVTLVSSGSGRDGQASFKDSRTGLQALLPLDISFERQKLATWVDPVAEYVKSDADGDGRLEITAVQRIIGASHPDTIGLLKTTFVLVEGSYRAATETVCDSTGAPLASVGL